MKLTVTFSEDKRRIEIDNIEDKSNFKFYDCDGETIIFEGSGKELFSLIEGRTCGEEVPIPMYLARNKNTYRQLNLYNFLPTRQELDDGRKYWANERFGFTGALTLPDDLFRDIKWEDEPQQVKVFILKEEDGRSRENQG